MDYTGILTKYSWVIQIAGVVAFGYFVTWLARRSRPKVKDGWVYVEYAFPIKLVSAGFVLFMLAALWHNGSALFREDWWVPPAIIAITAGAFWLAYDVFLTTLRWNEEEIELHRYLFPMKAIRIRDVTSLQPHPNSQAISVFDTSGSRIRFNVGYRVGAADLIAYIQNTHAAA